MVLHWRKKFGSGPGSGGRTERLVLLRKKTPRVTPTGRFCIDRVGDRAGRVSSTACHAIHFRQLRAGTPGDRRTRGGLGPAKRISKQEEPGQFVTGLFSSGGPASEDGNLHADRKKRFGKGGGKADQGRPVTTKEVTGIETGWREDLFPEKVSLPLSFPFESDVTTYSCARPMPGRAASRPAPRRKRPASSKALPMSCMPTGILLSAAMPTGRDRPGRPARFRDRV